MARQQSVVAVTPLGVELEVHRRARGMTRAAAYKAAGWRSHQQWHRLLTEDRRFEPALVIRAAKAVGMDALTALRLARVAVVPDDTCRVMTQSEVLALQNVS
jgi:hypothetical protein